MVYIKNATVFVNQSVMKTTITVVCYSSKKLATGECPLLLQICRGGQRKYKSLGITIHPKFWDTAKEQPKRNCPNRDSVLKTILQMKSELQSRILQLEASGVDFTLATLLNPEAISKVSSQSVEAFYLHLIAECEKAGNVGNRLIFRNSYNSIKAFGHGDLNISFKEITPEWLDRYEAWLRAKGNQETTLSLLFRTLRSVYNKAIQAKCAPKENYPFKEFKISKFNTKTKKRAISKEEILKFRQAVPRIGQHQYIELSKDIFFFSYLCGGISFVDLANLQAANISEGRLQYKRQKTGKEINVGIPAEAASIIAKYASQNKGYLFPILDDSVHITPIQKQNRIHKMLGKVNKCLKLIAAQLGISANLTTYVSRHSFATVLKRSGIEIALISEILGHSDLSTTQIYLDSFEKEQVDAAMQNLL